MSARDYDAAGRLERRLERLGMDDVHSLADMTDGIAVHFTIPTEPFGPLEERMVSSAIIVGAGGRVENITVRFPSVDPTRVPDMVAFNDDLLDMVREAGPPRPYIARTMRFKGRYEPHFRHSQGGNSPDGEMEPMHGDLDDPNVALVRGESREWEVEEAAMLVDTLVTDYRAAYGPDSP